MGSGILLSTFKCWLIISSCEAKKQLFLASSLPSYLFNFWSALMGAFLLIYYGTCFFSNSYFGFSQEQSLLVMCEI